MFFPLSQQVENYSQISMHYGDTKKVYMKTTDLTNVTCVTKHFFSKEKKSNI